jgi:nitrate/nitrite transporter NarK
MTPSMRSGPISLSLLFVAQVFNAAAGPCTMAPVSQLSCSWFAPKERSFATAISSQASNFGACIGFVLCPLVVPSAAQMPYLLYGLAGASMLTAIACFVHFPSMPPLPPSAAAETQLLQKGDGMSYLRGIKDAVTNPSCMLLILAGGLQSGVFASWNGAVPDMLTTLHVGSTTAGFFAFACSLAGILGGIALGKIADRVLPRRLKFLILVCFAVSIVFFVWFTLSFPILSLPAVLPSTFWTALCSITLSGLFIGAVNPLFYELAAELTFPVPEATSAALVTWTLNLGGAILLFCASEINTAAMNVVLLGCIVLCMGAIALVRERYGRLDMEAVHCSSVQ